MGGPTSSRAPCLMPSLPLVMARTPKSVRVSSRTVMAAPGFDMSLDAFTKASAGFPGMVCMSVPLRDKVADGFGANANDFHHIVAFKERAVT